MSCLICDAGDPRAMTPINADTAVPALSEFGSSRGTVGAVETRICTYCGSASQVPLPTEQALADAYARLDDQRYLAESANRQRAATAALRLVERYARANSGDLLDVGCSAGYFLTAAQAGGWRVTGVEPSAVMAGVARQTLGDRVIQAGFAEADLPAKSFSVITLWDVLEHVRSPRQFIRRAADLSLPGGHLFINVPRQDSLVAKVLGTRWPLRLPEHLHYFSLRGLRALLEAEGFEFLTSSQHPVWFSSGYVLHRLSQHGLPFGGAARALSRGRLGRVNIPLLMGEMTVVARRSG